MKKIEFLPSSLPAVEQLRVDVDKGALKFYTLSEAPTGIFHPNYSEKCFTFAAAVSGSGVLDYLVVLALRPDWEKTGDGKVIDIDTAAFCFKTDDLKAAPSGAAMFHQHFEGRTTPVSGYEAFDLESTVNDLHSKLIPESKPISAVPPHYVNAISFSIKKFNELLGAQATELERNYYSDTALDAPRTGDDKSARPLE